MRSSLPSIKEVFVGRILTLLINLKCTVFKNLQLFICHCQSDSTLDNIEEWRGKLTMLMRSKDEQEIVSREKKERRDFEQLSVLATRMELHR